MSKQIDAATTDLSAVLANSYIFKDRKGNFYLEDKHIYDTIVHGLLPGSPPTFETDADVQNWLIKPHGNA